MTRKKLKHFAEMKEWSHVLEPTLSQEPLKTAGTWGKRVILELACGRGTYTVGLAQRFPDFTVVGVDIKGSRMWHGGKLALDLGLQNARFLRIRIEDLLDYFAPQEVDEVWITFPDPHPTEGNEKRRLTSPRFLELYKKILKPGGFLHLKTDNEALFEYSRVVLKGAGFKEDRVVEDVYGEGVVEPLLQEVQTAYEQRYLKEGRRIRYAAFKQGVV
jgi:tRNA (guanine-N7-)-methyltransferase